MALPSLTLRNTKGSPLTFNEMDTNLQNLQGATINVTTGTGTGEGLVLNLNDTLNLVGGPGIQILADSSNDRITISNTGTVSAGTGLSQVGTTVSLNTATTSTIGGIKVGANLSITADGTLSAQNSFVLNTATASVLGGIKVGSGLSITGDGTLSSTGGSFSGTVATLTATNSIVLNGITLTQANGVLVANYTTSTSTTSGVSTTTSFQARLENSFVDDANAGTNFTNNGSVTWSNTSKFSSYSLDFGLDATQTTKKISTTATNSMNFGTGDFTIEAWVYTPTHTVQAPNYYHIIAATQTQTGGKWLAFNDNGSSYDVFWGDETNSLYYTAGAGPILANDQWHHIVAMRRSGALYLGYDGNMSLKNSSYTVTHNWSNLNIGGPQSIGKIDSVRVSNTALYSTGSTYTVPTAEFPTGGTVVTTSTTSALPFMPLAGGTMTGTIVVKGFTESVYNWGNVTGTITPDATSATIHRMTLTGNITLNTVTNITTGSNIKFILTQDGTGSRTLTNTGWKWLGGSKTLTTTANSIDVITVFYDGTNYIAELNKAYS